MEKVLSLGDLVLVHLATEGEMAQSSSVLLGDHCGVTFGVIDMLPCAKRGAHRRAYQYQWLLSGQLLPCSSSHLFVVEIPAPSVLVLRRQVESKPGKDAVARAELRNG